MTTTEQPEGATRLSFSTLLRIAAIFLGIASATLMATKSFGFTFTNKDFLTLLKGVDNFVGALVWPLEFVIVRPSLNWLHERGVDIPLSDNWKNVFVLLWFYFAAQTRAWVGQAFSVSLPRRTWKVLISHSLQRWTWAGLCAFMAGLLAGTVPLASPSLFWGTAACFHWWAGVRNALDANLFKRVRDLEDKARVIGNFRWNSQFYTLLAMGSISCGLLSGFPDVAPILREPTTYWWPFLVHDLSVIIVTSWAGASTRWPDASRIIPLSRAAIFAVLGLEVYPEINSIFAKSPSPGIATLIATFAILSAFRLIASAQRNVFVPDGSLQKWLDDPETHSSLDILAVLGGTAAIVYAAHQLS